MTKAWELPVSNVTKLKGILLENIFSPVFQLFSKLYFTLFVFEKSNIDFMLHAYGSKIIADFVLAVSWYVI